MVSESLVRARRRVGLAMFGGLSLIVAWYVSPGLPVLWGPWASATTKEAGRTLFEHEWQPYDALAQGDGIGPVFNERSCVACHFQGGVGGGGSRERNVTAFEVHPTPRDHELHAGVVHAHAINPADQETVGQLQKLFPSVDGGTESVCGRRVKRPEFDPVRTESINTPALFGAGWIDRISSKAITNNRMKRLVANSTDEFNLNFDSLPVGKARLLPDGRVGKFGWRAQFATLEEFVAHACANELGLGNPLMEQAKPLGRPDYPAVKPDMNRRQLHDLLAFVDTLPRPIEALPDDAWARDQVERGKRFFSEVGCAACHVPDLGGVKGVYSDFLLYQLEARPNGAAGSYGEAPPEMPPLPEDHPAPNEWKTPPLWGVADSAPYFHDGGATTLEAAILRHGGQAAQVTKAYQQLSAADREAVVAFLKTLKAPRDAVPVKEQAIDRKDALVQNRR